MLALRNNAARYLLSMLITGQGGAQVMSQHGMGGGPQGMSGSTQSIGGIPQGQSVGSGYDSYGQFAQPNLGNNGQKYEK